MAKPSPWKPFVCSQVKIEWKGDEFDWRYFYVISCSGNIARIRGIDDPETGSKHFGDECDAKWSEVVSVSAMRPGESSAFFDMESGVLERAKALVDGRDKQDHYGSPEEFFTRLALSWTALLKPKLKDGEEITPMNAALMMNSHKGLRLVVDPMHDDSETDLVGYGYIFARLKRFLLRAGD